MAISSRITARSDSTSVSAGRNTMSAITSNASGTCSSITRAAAALAAPAVAAAAVTPAAATIAVAPVAPAVTATLAPRAAVAAADRRQLFDALAGDLRVLGQPQPDPAALAVHLDHPHVQLVA